MRLLSIHIRRLIKEQRVYSEPFPLGVNNILRDAWLDPGSSGRHDDGRFH